MIKFGKNCQATKLTGCNSEDARLRALVRNEFVSFLSTLRFSDSDLDDEEPDLEDADPDSL